jgi:hypothetical protein
MGWPALGHPQPATRPRWGGAIADSRGVARYPATATPGLQSGQTEPGREIFDTVDGPVWLPEHLRVRPIAVGGTAQLAAPCRWRHRVAGGPFPVRQAARLSGRR